jgi:uncharacterized protein YcbK (DUF882 family)
MINGFPPNFSYAELRCKSGDQCPYADRLRHLAWTLQVIRDEFGKPIRVNSGYRSPEHNKEVGGVKNSQHVQARAADLTPASGRDSDLDDLKQVVERLALAGKIPDGGIGNYATFVHYDMRPSGPARWGD